MIGKFLSQAPLQPVIKYSFKFSSMTQVPIHNLISILTYVSIQVPPHVLIYTQYRPHPCSNS